MRSRLCTSHALVWLFYQDNNDSPVHVTPAALETAPQTTTATVEAVAAPPEPAPVRRDSYERVERLREEMRSAGRSTTFDISVTRQSRSTERFTERLKSQESLKAMREKRTPTPTGLGGKFSAAFNKFASPDERSKRGESPLTRAKSLGARADSVNSRNSTSSEQPLRSATPRSESSSGSAAHPVEEPVKPSKVEKAQSAPPEESQRSKSRYDTPQETASTKQPPTTAAGAEESSESPARQSRAQRRSVERSKTFDTGVPSRASPRVLERMAKFGQSTENPKSHQTVTTKNAETDRFERHTHQTTEDQPTFDIDIQIRREPGPDAGGAVNKTAAITVGRDQVQVGEIDRALPKSKEESMNIWDTEIPVTDGREKVSPHHLIMDQSNITSLQALCVS